MAEYVITREAAVGPAYVVMPPTLTIEDLAALRYDTAHNLYRIPFGPARGQITVRNLIRMNWKGRKGDAFIEAAKPHGALLAANELARKISKAYAGIKGVVKVKGTYYPRKALAQKKWRKEHPELVDLYNEHVAPAIGKTKKAPVKFVILPA